MTVELTPIETGMTGGPEAIQANFESLSNGLDSATAVQQSMGESVKMLNGFTLTDGYIKRIGTLVIATFAIGATGSTALRYKDFLTLPVWATPKATAYAALTWDQDHKLVAGNVLVNPTGTMYIGGIGDAATVTHGTGWCSVSYFVD